MQDKLTARLADLHHQFPLLRSIVRLALAAVGRGGEGDVGQQIRDDILRIQARNEAKVCNHNRRKTHALQRFNWTVNCCNSEMER